MFGLSVRAGGRAERLVRVKTSASAKALVSTQVGVRARHLHGVQATGADVALNPAARFHHLSM